MATQVARQRWLRALVSEVTLCAIAVVIAFAAPSTSGAADVLQAGVATADITPAPGLRMWGYSNRTEGATGALDPLMAKALVLRLGEKSVAIVTLDLGRPPEEELLEKLHHETFAKCGIENLMITASHTHQAPTMETYDGMRNEFAEKVTETIGRIICEAAAATRPVRIGVGVGEADLAHNRRRRLPDGRIAMQWRNVQRDATAPVDKEYTVIRVDTADGKPLAVLFQYACHPVVLGPDHLQYSADYVGGACAAVEKSLGAPCLFLQGGCGNINPYVDKTPVSEGGIEAMRAMGAELGSLLVGTAQKIKPIAAEHPSLRFEQRVVPLSVRWDLQNPEVSGLLSRVYGQRFDLYLKRRLQNGIVPATLTTVIIDDTVALVGMPGEVFVDFQLDLKQRSPIKHTLLVGYSNGYHAYFPTIADAAAGGYGGKVATYVEAGAGERLTNEGLVSIYRLLGQLSEIPKPEDFQLLEWDEIKDSQGK